ncbi:coagulogen-like [Limulus polyphemus]|uniref:Coagulogen-like n=1 Tax=Limulus polyphemus TaxID=6850 RepID=A0ABM1T979_LIMPO|nr:coagulogen-like [Limulus polyphemus]
MKIWFIFILILGTVGYTVAGDINQPLCLCEEPEGILGRKNVVTPEVQEKIEEEVKNALEAEKDEGISGRGLPLFIRLSRECGTQNCRNDPSVDRCYNSLPIPGYPRQCSVFNEKCEPNFGYNTNGDLRIIVQAPKAGFRQCLWQHKCRITNGLCGTSGRCRQSRSAIRLLTYNLESGTFHCEQFQRCCGCPCSH